VNDSLDVKENYDHALDFAFQLSRIFWSRRVRIFRVRLILSSSNALLIARFSVAHLPRFAQNLKLFLCRIHWDIASDQIYDCKYNDVEKRHVHPAAWNAVHWLPRYAVTIIYCCISLLQLLYRYNFLGVPSIVTIFCFKCFYFPICIHYIFPPMGYPQAEYKTSQSLEAKLLPTTDPLFLLGCAIVINIFVFVFFVFWRICCCRFSRGYEVYT
jgi:hypothetical protein